MKIELNSSDVSEMAIKYRKDYELYELVVSINFGDIGRNRYRMYFDTKSELMELVSAMIDPEGNELAVIEPSPLIGPPPLEINTAGG